jgi:hypothetical protein
VLSTWNSEVYWPAMAVSLALGALFGLFLSRTRRIEGPIADLDRALAAQGRLGDPPDNFHSAGGIQRTHRSYDLAVTRPRAGRPATSSQS